MAVISCPATSVENVSNGRAGEVNLFGDLLLSETNLAQFKDLRQYIRSHSSSRTPPDVLTLSDGLKMFWIDAERLAT